MRAELSWEAKNLATTTLVHSAHLPLDQDLNIIYGRLPSTDDGGQHDTMMAAQAVPHLTQPVHRKRVKVYELRNNDWFDRGTGFCSSTYGTSEDGELTDPRIIVEAEDSQEHLLLDTRISHEDGFQKQQGMSHHMPRASLTFINEVQQSFAPHMGDDNMSEDVPVDIPASITLPPAELANLEDIETNMRIMSTTDTGRDALCKSIVSDEYIQKLIPLVEVAEDLESLADLHHLCNIVKILLLLNDTAIFEQVISDECLMGIVGALEYDPDFPSHKANHREWLQKSRYKEVVSIANEAIQRKIHQTYRLQYLKDVVLARILDDPTFSVLNSLIFFNQVDIIQYVQNNSAFLTELFGIFTDASQKMTRKKQGVFFIHHCCLVIKSLQPAMRGTFFAAFLSHGLLRVLDFGLRNYDVTVRISATEVLVLMMDHDPIKIRRMIYRHAHDNTLHLTDTLVDLLQVEVDLGIRAQICDALKILLDPSPIPVTIEINGDGTDDAPQVTRRLPTDPHQDLYFNHFYEHSAIRLYKPLLDLEGQQQILADIGSENVFNYLNDFTAYFVRSHHHRYKFFVLQHNIACRFVELLRSPIKHLQLVAIRFLRQLIACRDEFYIRHIMEKRLIEHVFDLLERCLPRDNLICSACLDFFEFFVKEDVVDLTKHLVTTYNDRIKKLSYFTTFNDLLTGRYPQLATPSTQHQAILASNGHLAGEEQLVLPDTDGDLPSHQTPNGALSSALDSITMDPDEEAYWNGDDEDDELQNSLSPPDEDQADGESPVQKQLVDYPSDEEDAEDEGNSDPVDFEIEAEPVVTGSHNGNAMAASNVSARVSDDAVEAEDGGARTRSGSEAHSDSEKVSPPSSVRKVASASTLGGSPPERISEKRRREEDEEDEMSKMMLQNKRRNSRSNSLNGKTSIFYNMTTTKVNGGSNGNGNSNGPDAEGPRGDGQPATGGPTPVKKISINITSPALQAMATEATGPGQGDDNA
ncbi:Platinum sensitivity protein [Sporothrix epigloea]|uniref:Platinum sensitivity protein n=1 Tax=Sporothrix epigloea TaxID=1892477 RepID=A0ABP0E0Y9_9PEZI